MSKGQVQLTFNWIFVLIAGAVILLFFAGIAVKQRTVAEDQLAGDVVRIMETIFTGASVSEKTKNVIDTSGLSEFTIFFSCSDGVGEYGLEGKGATIQDNINPLFAPSTIKSPRMYTWSLPYHLPYKVSDFLFISSPNTKYILLDNTPFFEEVQEELAEFENVQQVFSNELNTMDLGNTYQVRLVAINRNFVSQPMPQELRKFSDDKVSLIIFLGDTVEFYHKDGNSWSSPTPVDLISMPGVDRDAAKYAAFFSADAEMYQCGMGKAYKRLYYVSKVYYGKWKEMQSNYEAKDPLGKCQGIIKNRPDNMEIALLQLHNRAQSCQQGRPCSSLPELAGQVQSLNSELGIDCISLY